MKILYSYLLICLICLLFPFLCLGQDTIDLTIDDAIKMAIENNQMLRSEYYRKKETDTIKQEAFSFFLPKIDMVGRTILDEKPVKMEFPSFVPDQPPQEFEMSLTPDYMLSMQFNQPLFLGGRAYYNWRISELNQDISNYRYQEIKDELILNIRSNYFLCYILKEIMNAVEEGIELSKSHFEQVDTFYEAGNATYQEWLRAKVQLSSLEPDLFSAESNHRNAVENLKLLLGTEKDINLITPLEMRDFLPDEDLFIQNLKNNLGLRQMEKAVDIADYNEKIAFSEYLPMISLSMDYSIGSDKFKFNRDHWEDNYSISLNIQFNIFDGFARRARRQRAEYSKRSMEYQAMFYKDSLRVRLEHLLDEIETNYKRARSYLENLENAKESVRVSNLYYEEGLLTSFEVNAVNLDLTKARLNHLNAIYDYYISIFNLKKLIPDIEK